MEGALASYAFATASKLLSFNNMMLVVFVTIQGVLWIGIWHFIHNYGSEETRMAASQRLQWAFSIVSFFWGLWLIYTNSSANGLGDLANYFVGFIMVISFIFLYYLHTVQGGSSRDFGSPSSQTSVERNDIEGEPIQASEQDNARHSQDDRVSLPDSTDGLRHRQTHSPSEGNTQTSALNDMEESPTPTDDWSFINDVQFKIGRDIWKLATMLGITESRIEEARENYPKDLGQACAAIMKAYREKCGNNPAKAKNELVRVLRSEELCRNDIADKICS